MSDAWGIIDRSRSRGDIAFLAEKAQIGGGELGEVGTLDDLLERSVLAVRPADERHQEIELAHLIGAHEGVFG
jgi:hypothetical protein